MKLSKWLLALVAIVGLVLPAAAQQSSKKALVAYFSLTNNTQLVAREIAKQAGADIFRIETVDAYPAEYRAVTEQAKKELESGYRPKLKKRLAAFEGYNVIYLGSPNWWGTIAPAVFTFLESYDFSGKTIIPFITHEGSRMGNSESDIRRVAPKAKLLEGLAIRGGNASKSAPEVKAWLGRVGQKK